MRPGGKEVGTRRRDIATIAFGLAIAASGGELDAQPVMARPGQPAVGTTSEAGRCRLIADDRERLACFDRLFAIPATGAGAPGAAAEHGPAGGDGSTPGHPATALEAMPPGKGSGEGSAQLPAQAPAVAREERDLRRSLGASLSERWELDDEHDRGRFLFRPYKPMYVLIADWSSNPNLHPSSPNPANAFDGRVPLDAVEAKYQLSFKTKAVKGLIAKHGDLWLGYTQTSHWQVYNSGLSRPFRETSYEPEVMAVFRTDYSLLGWRGRMAGINLNHQSNGRSEPFSRSWNRVIAQFGFERDNWMMMIRPWWRIPESAVTDDNPDIEDYMGRADLLLVRKSEGHETTLMLRHSLRSGSRSHGAVELGYAFPIASYLKGYIQVFSGYGASMVDYNHRQTRIGVGISLVQWL